MIAAGRELAIAGQKTLSRFHRQLFDSFSNQEAEKVV